LNAKSLPPNGQFSSGRKEEKGSGPKGEEEEEKEFPLKGQFPH
jgi:hypothetical protein